LSSPTSQSTFWVPLIKKQEKLLTKNDLFGKNIAGSILVFPNGIGSSVGAYTIYSLKSNNSAPAAMACQKADLTVASGCALANIPLFILSPDEYDNMKDGDEVSLG